VGRRGSHHLVRRLKVLVTVKCFFRVGSLPLLPQRNYGPSVGIIFLTSQIINNAFACSCAAGKGTKRQDLFALFTQCRPEPSLKSSQRRCEITKRCESTAAHKNPRTHTLTALLRSSTARSRCSSDNFAMDWRTARIPYGYASLHHPTLSLPTNPKNYGHFLLALVFPIHVPIVSCIVAAQAGESRWAMRSFWIWNSCAVANLVCHDIPHAPRAT
jgi:hypothetical protein